MVCGCCGKKEELTPEDRADAEEKLEETKESYKPTGGGRLPGSKFNITGAQINDTNDKADLETLVKTAKRDQRRGGCCCLCKSETVLDKWGWIQTHAEVTTFLEKVEKHTGFDYIQKPDGKAAKGGCCGGKPDATESMQDQQATDVAADVVASDPDMPALGMPPATPLAGLNRLVFNYLGQKPRNYPNPNHYCTCEGIHDDNTCGSAQAEGSEPSMENLLRLNRKKLLWALERAELESMPFSMPKVDKAKMKIIKNPSDKEVDGMSLFTVRKKLIQRGHRAPPYHVSLRGDAQYPLVELVIGKDNVVCRDPNNVDTILDLGEYLSVEKLKVLFNNDDVHTSNRDLGDSASKKQAELQAHAFLGTPPPALADPDWPTKPGVRALKTKACCSRRTAYDEHKFKAFLKLCAEDPRFKEGQPIVQPSFIDRSCQNCYCNVLFWLYWCGMMGILVVAALTGDPYRLVRPIDYEAHSCGNEIHVNTKDKFQLYYPRLAEDTFALYQDGTTPGDWDCTNTKEGCFYGVCVNSCPVKGSVVCNYETDMLLDELCLVDGVEGCSETEKATRKADAEKLAKERRGCWVVGMNQVEILRRCFPWERPLEATEYSCEIVNPDGTSTYKQFLHADGNTHSTIDTDTDKNGDRCSKQPCNAGQIEAKLREACNDGVVHRKTVTEEKYTSGSEDMSSQMSSAFNYVMQIFADIRAALYLIVLMGPLAAGLSGFTFVYMMSCCAGLIVWCTVAAVQFLLITAALFAFWMAGYFETAMVALNDQLSPGVNETSIMDRFDGNSTFDRVIDVKELGSDARSFLTQYDFFGGEAGTTEYTNQTLWTVAAWVTAALAVIYMFLICCLYKHIRMAIALVKESGSTIRKMPSLVLYPFFTYFWVTVVFVYCAGMSTFILSSTATLEDLSNIGSKLNATQVSELNFDQVYVDAQGAVNELQNIGENASMLDERYSLTSVEDNTLVKYTFIYHFLGFLWTSEFVSAIGMITIAGAVASDYWVTDTRYVPQWPVLASFGRTMRYHTGSAAYGSLIVALVRLVRYVMMYVDMKTQELQKNNIGVKILMKCVHCLLWCLEKCARYITMQAYIMIAIEGNGFCLSAWRSFKLLFSNTLRIATTQVLAFAILILSKVCITAGCTAGSILIMKEVEYFTEGEGYVENPLYPAAIIFIAAYFVSTCFMEVYSMAINTMLLSFCLDEQKFLAGNYAKKLDGDRPFNADGTENFDGRMFCQINEKEALVVLVSKQARSLQDSLKETRIEERAADLAALQAARVSSARP